MMEWKWPRRERSSGSGDGWHWRQRRRVAAYRIGAGGGRLSRRPFAVADLNSGGSDRVLKEQWSGKSVLSDSTCSSSSQLEESSESLDKKLDGRVKLFVRRQTLKEVVDRPSQPGVIAELMGLDELPPKEMARKRQTTVGGFLQRQYFTEFEERHASTSDLSSPMSTPENQGLRSTAQGTELKVGKDKNMEFSNAFATFVCSQPVIICNSRNSIDEKDFFSDESLKNAAESNEELVEQHSNNDNLVNAYEGAKSLFRKNLHDLKWLVPSNEARDATISSFKHERSKLLFGYERKPARSDHTKETNRINQSLKLAKLQKEDNNQLNVLTLPIVILKPCSESHLAGTNALSSQKCQHVQLGKRRQMSESRFPEIYAKRINRWNSLGRIDAYGEKRKDSTKIAGDVTNYMRYYMISDTKKALFLGDNMYPKNENLFLYCTDNTQNSSALLTSPIKIRGKSTRNNVHERLKMDNHSREAECSSTHLKTLGEMFTLSDKETSNISCKHLKVSQISDWKSGRCEMPTRSGSSSSVTSSDGWNDWYLIKLPKSTHFPHLPISNRHRCLSSRHGDNDYFCNTKQVLNLAPERSMKRKLSQRGCFLKRSFTGASNILEPFSYKEDQYNQHRGNKPRGTEESRDKCYEKAPISNYKICPDDARSNAVNLVVELSTSQFMQKKRRLLKNKELAEQKANNKHQMKNIEISCNNHKVMDIFQETLSLGNKVDYLPDHLEPKETEIESPSSSKDTLQPSPVSVLEPIMKQGGLHIPDQLEAIKMEVEIPEESTEFHARLQLVESDLEDACVDGSENIRSHDDVSSASSQFVEQKGQIIEEFVDEEERDFAYLLDILIDSDFHSANQSKLYNKGCLQEYPLGKGTLEKLEKKYRRLILWSGLEKNLVFWSRSERRLLFYFINCILAEIIAPCTEP